MRLSCQHFHSSMCQGKNREGVPEPLRPSPPWPPSTWRSRRRTCFHTSLFSNRSAYIKMIDYIHRHSEVDQMNWQLTGKSVHCWVNWCCCLGLQSTTECSGAFGYKNLTFTFTFAKLDKRKQKIQNTGLCSKNKPNMSGLKFCKPD